MEQTIRIDKFLADQNIGSRKEVGVLIRRGKVSVNGVVIRKADAKVKLTDEIICNEQKVDYNKYTYIMMNKPAGVLSATKDRKDKTVLDIIPAEFFRKDLFPAGRLDKDTTGLLILTNDGDYAHKMLSPKNKVYKLYRAELDAPINDDDIKAFEEGIGGFLPAKLYSAGGCSAEVLVCEGKFHQIKRMFYSRQKNVLKLERLKIGGLELSKDLGLSQCKLLSKEEADLVFLSELM